MVLRLASLIVFLALAQLGAAQGEFVAGYGIYSSSEMGKDPFKPSTNSITTLSGDYNTHTSGMGPWVIGYKYNLGKHLSFGFMGVVSTFTTNYFGDKLVEDIKVDSKQSVYTNQLSTLIKVAYSWFRIKNLTLYSSCSGGLCYGNFKNSSENIRTERLTPAYQVNLLGVRAGGRLGTYLELGYGYVGIANVGVSLYLK